MAAPTVVTGLRPRYVVESLLPPAPLWIATVDPNTLTKTADIYSACPPCLFGGGIGAADLHGRQAYATAWASGRPAIAVIDTKLNAVTGLIDTSPLEVRGLAADPVRARLYAAGVYRTPDSRLYPIPQLSVIDTRSLQVLATIPLPPPAGYGMAGPVVTEDGSRLYITSADTLAVVDLSSWSVVKTKALPSRPYPMAIAVNAERNELYIGLDLAQGVLVLAADSLARLRNLITPGTVVSLWSRPSDGALLVETDSSQGAFLEAVDPITSRRLAPGNQTGFGLAASFDGKRVYGFQSDSPQSGQPFADFSDRLLAVDAISLATLGSAVLDTRAADDPSRNNSQIVGTFIASVPKVSDAVEYFHAGLGHYFITSLLVEINALDSEMFPGWQRTGQTVPVYAQRDDGPKGSVAVCRFYGLPEKGLNSHFYSASATECAEVQQNFGDSWLLESSEVFDVYPADSITGACLFDTTPVYRVYNNRPDANHRYTTSPAIRESMVATGWVAEGYGPDAVAFCVPR